MNWDPLSEGWSKVYEAPGVGIVYYSRIEASEKEQEEDGPDIDHMNDEGEMDETELPAEVWLVRYRGREMFTTSGEAYARKILTSNTKNQIDLFA
jgi:hypothetical protein